MERKINKEIREYREAMFWGLTLRQFLFSVLGLGISVGIYFLLRAKLGMEAVSWACIFGMLPCAMLGFVTTGVMANDNGFYDCLLCAAERSGEKFWRMPDDAEYETLIESDYADVRNTSKDGCGAITAGLFLKKFTAKRPWLHLDIAGTADNTGIVWQHQVPGATGTAVSTLYHLAQILFETSEEEPA